MIHVVLSLKENISSLDILTDAGEAATPRRNFRRVLETHHMAKNGYQYFCETHPMLQMFVLDQIDWEVHKHVDSAAKTNVTLYLVTNDYTCIHRQRKGLYHASKNKMGNFSCESNILLATFAKYA